MPGCSGVLKTAVVEINELLPDGMSAIAANLLTSDILSLARTCSALCKSGPLVSTEKIYCTQAAIDIVAAGPSLMKDEAFEYLASGELRLDPCYGCVNFDDVCYLDARAMRKISYPPQLDDVLQMWERLDAPEDYTARSADRRVKQQAGVLPLTKQFGPPDAITVLAPVANRYRSGGMQGCKFANLPRKRREITELMRLASRLLDQLAYASAAKTLSHVLALDPDNPNANYELGLLYLSGAGWTKDDQLGIKLLDTAGMQGNFNAAFEVGHLHHDRGEWRDAQRAFEAALRSAWTMPKERAAAAYNLGIVHQEQGDDAGSEGCFLRARKEGCLRAPYNLGAMYLEKGQMRKAKDMLEEALRGELAAKACCALGSYHEACHSPKKARTYYEKALAGDELLASRFLADMRRLGGSADHAL
jgi:Tfp pilus assembly protein PilF